MKIDGEKGEGLDLVKKFNVSSYPTVILLDKEGKEIDRIVGFGSSEHFMLTVRRYLAGERTLSWYHSEFEKNGNNPKFAYALTRKYKDRDDYDKVAIYSQKILEIDPDDKTGFGEEARFNIARASARNGDVSNLKAFNEGLTNDSKFQARSYSLIVNFYVKNDDRENVLKTYEDAIIRMSDNAGTMNDYAWHILSRKIVSHYARGIEVAERALKLKPGSDAIWDTLGQLHFANGNAEAAIKAMKKASELKPDKKSYKEHIARYMKPQA